MTENTSVGNIQMDLKINQKSVDVEMAKVSKYISNGFKSMFSGMVNQTSNFMKNSLGKMNSGFKSFAQSGTQSTEKISKNINKMNTEYEKTEAKIIEIRKELTKLFAEQDEIAREFQHFPAFSGMTKEESMAELLKSNPKYNELAEQIDKLTARMDPLIYKNQKLADEINRVGKESKNTGTRMNIMGKTTNKAGKDVDKTTLKTRLFGDEMKKSETKVAGFAAMINKSFRTILRRVFVYSVMLKGIRNLVSYMGSALKTNKAFVHSLNQTKTNLMVSFQPIYDHILPALNTLMNAVAKVTAYIATAISSLFGKTYKQSFGAAKNLDEAKKAMAGYGKAAKKSSKDAQGALMRFDEINQSDIKEDSNTDSGGIGAGDFEMTMPDTSTIDLSGLEKLKELLQPTIDSLKNLWKSLEPLKKFTVKGLNNFYNNFLVPVGKWSFGEGIPKFVDIITNGLALINWEPINDGLSKLWKALTPFAINVGEGLLWFWENVLIPLGTWSMNEIVPRFLDMLASSIDALKAIIEVFKPLGFWLWNKFLQPLASWTGGAIVDILDGISYAFECIADYIEGIQDVIVDSDRFLGALVNVGVYLVEGLFKGIIFAISGIGSWLKENLIDPIVNWVRKLFGIASPSTVFMEIGTWLVEGLFEGISNTWTKIVSFFSEQLEFLNNLFLETWNYIKEFMNEVWVAIAENTSEVWSNIKEFLSETWNNLKENASEIWNSIREFFSETWDSIKTKTSETWNSIKSFLIEKIWNSIKTSAQTIWEGIKKFILDPMNQAWTKLKEIWDRIKKYILDKWNEIKQGISSMKDNLVNAIKEPFNIAQNFIDGVIKNAFNWGKNLIGEFVSGIKSMGGKVTNAVSGVAGGIKDFVGFSSPTKKGPGSSADEWMPNLMGMLADGIQDNIYEVSAAVSMTAGSIQQGMQLNTSDMATSVGSAISQSIQGLNNDGGNIQIVVQIGDDTLTDKVINNVNRQNRIAGKTVITV